MKKSRVAQFAHLQSFDYLTAAASRYGCESINPNPQGLGLWLIFLFNWLDPKPQHLLTSKKTNLITHCLSAFFEGKQPILVATSSFERLKMEKTRPVHQLDTPFSTVEW